MVRPLTERTANLAKLDPPLPQGFAEAIQHLVNARNCRSGSDQARLYTRDLHEEALRELIGRAEAGEVILFLALSSVRARPGRLAIAVAGRGDSRRIDQRASLDGYGPGSELSGDLLEQPLL
ncbi:MAG TPA: hypothetical protein VNZ61_26005 [Roseomonas sp.]|nr:hypothetical protein [Roseomonas sp.]